LNEEVAAAVVLREQVSEGVLLKFCGERLAEYKCPKKLFFVESIPQTATGKIRRNEVAAALLDGKR
jgi:acyl-coenzyme A synthetase/AMP-(fatty) acid ligase